MKITLEFGLNSNFYHEIFDYTQQKESNKKYVFLKSKKFQKERFNSYGLSNAILPK